MNHPPKILFKKPRRLKGYIIELTNVKQYNLCMIYNTYVFLYPHVIINRAQLLTLLKREIEDLTEFVLSQ